VVTDSMRKILRGLSLACFLLVGWLAIQFTPVFEMNAWAGSPPSPKSTKAAGDAEHGRAVFNGKACATTAMAVMGTRANDRNLQLTQPRSSLNSILHR
jgi:hypothetical protein